MKTVLLNPGPVTLSSKVRAALDGPDLCHREPEFAVLQKSLRQHLTAVYDLDPRTWAAVVMTGSGTAAVEAMISSMVPPDGHLLVVENGVYGERMTRMANAHHIPHSVVRGPWQNAPDVDAIDNALKNNPDVSHIAVVHHETTTGRLNDLEAIGRICAEYDVRMLVDGVSSFGAEEIKFDAWRIDACAATANKCLHGVPGTAFAIVRREASGLQNDSCRSVYLDLATYLRNQDGNGTPFTQSIQTFYALEAALSEFFSSGGWDARRQLFRARLQRIDDCLERLGVATYLDADHSSCVLHAYQLPEGIDYTTLHDALKRDGFIIYAGQGGLADEVFRLSMMGDINDDDLTRLEQSLKRVLG